MPTADRSEFVGHESWQDRLLTPLLKRDVWDQIRSLAASKGENHAQENNFSGVRGDICWWRGSLTRELREQGGGQERQAARRCGQDLIHEEIHCRYLCNQ